MDLQDQSGCRGIRVIYLVVQTNRYCPGLLVDNGRVWSDHLEWQLKSTAVGWWLHRIATVYPIDVIRGLESKDAISALAGIHRRNHGMLVNIKTREHTLNREYL